MTEAQRKYREEYLQSDHWKAIRVEALERAEYRCQVCNNPHGLDVHHRTYERVGKERLADLTVLCRKCHDLFHGSKKKSPTKPTPKKKPQKKSRTQLNKDSKAKALREENDRLHQIQKENKSKRNILLAERIEIIQSVLLNGPGTTREISARSGLPVGPTGTTLASMRNRKIVVRLGKNYSDAPWRLK